MHDVQPNLAILGAQADERRRKVTEEKTITRDDVTKAAKAWVDAELALAYCDEWSGKKQASLSERCDDARDEFERLLDAWRDQQVERARASAIAEIRPRGRH